MALSLAGEQRRNARVAALVSMMVIDIEQGYILLVSLVVEDKQALAAAANIRA
eukprot:SAG22_NODE_8795_length_629_cov_0.996226_1_plen_53_part_00